MRQAIIIGILFCCLNISAMHKNTFSITSADGIEFPIRNTHAKQMKIFYPIYPENSSFRSEHTASALRFFMGVVEGVEQGTIKPSSFQTKYIISASKSKIPLSVYKEFDCGLENIKENKVATLLMSVARELRAEQLAILFVSLLSEEKNHHKMFSALMSASNVLQFQDKMDALCKNTYEPSLKRSNDFCDVLAVPSQSKRKSVTNSSGTLVATIDDKKKGHIIVKNSIGLTEARFRDARISFSNPTFSGNGFRFACVENVQGSYRNGFILLVWDVATWRLLVDARFLLDGNVHNMCLNHDGTKLVASVQAKVPLCAEGGVYATEYKNVIIDINGEDAEIVHMIPTSGIARSMYWRSDKTFVTSLTPDTSYQWQFKKRNENAGKELNFIQKVFLYGLYERIQEENRRYYQHEIKQFVVPLIGGYVKEYVMKSLPKRLRKWAQEVEKKYQFQ